MADASLVHELYAATPEYFDIISIPVPTVAEVSTDLATAGADPRRFVELVLLEPEAAGPGCDLDPHTGDVDRLDLLELGGDKVTLLISQRRRDVPEPELAKLL